MFRLSGDFIYALAVNLRPISNLTELSEKLDVYAALNGALPSLDLLLDGNVLGLRASWHKGELLRKEGRRVVAAILQAPDKSGRLDFKDASGMKSAFTTFEVTLKADLAVANLYAATPKGAYDTGTLAEFGLQAFPESLEARVPEAIGDAKQAARCVAFDLATAAAFHMHRAHEAVVHAYFRSLAPLATAPVKQPLGVWLQALEKENAPAEILAAVRDITTLHRNPVLHPEQSLKDSGEAIALLGSIHTSMRYMLTKIVAKIP